MAIMQIPVRAAVATPDAVVTTVLIRPQWYSGSWAIADFLEFEEYTDSDIHGDSQATFRFRYGDISRQDRLTYGLEGPADARDVYVCVQQQPATFVELPVVTFVGVIPHETLVMSGTENITQVQGRQKLVANGLDWLLGRRRLTDVPVVATVQPPGDTVFVTVSKVPTFNMRLSSGRQLLGNRSNGTIEITGPPTIPQVYGFGHDAKVWSVPNIIEFLLVHTDDFTSDDVEPHFSLVGQNGALDTFLLGSEPVVDPKGRDVRSIIRELLSRKRGLTAKVRWSVDAVGLPEGDVELNVRSLVSELLPVGFGRVMGPNPNTGDLDFDTDDTVLTASLKFHSVQGYDEIRVKGQPLQSCFSSTGATKAAELNIAVHRRGWKQSIQDGYDGSTDAARKRDAFDRVYRLFELGGLDGGGLPVEFDWFTQQPGPVSGHPLLPKVDEDGNFSTEDNEPSGLLNVRILDSIPILKSADAAHEADEVRFDKPFALVEYLDDPDIEGVWIDVSNPPDAADPYSDTQIPHAGETHSANLTPLDRSLAVDVHFSKANHVLGKNHFDPDPDFESQTEPVFDYDNMILTVAVETDYQPSVTVLTGIAAGKAFKHRVLEIVVPDAHFWVVAIGTVSGITTTGALAYYQGPRVVRNGMQRLREVAGLAKIYFGTLRRTMTLVKRGTIAEVEVGTFVRSVLHGYTALEINTVVSSITVNAEKNTTTIQTSHINLELVR